MLDSRRLASVVGSPGVTGAETVSVRVQNGL